MNSAARCLLVLAIVTLSFPAAARQQSAVKAAPVAQVPGYRGEYLANLVVAEGKLTELAEDVAAEDYTWRPASDVRSISEAHMHIATLNYLLAEHLGKPWPAGVPKTLEKITDKDVVLAELRRSFQHLREAVMKFKDANLEKKKTYAAQMMTNRNALLTHLGHLHEHLGQSIVYARMNGVAPSWSR
ncbi:MAG TPA: DinB family protein [Thermoanaerobaculia bacterium]